MCERAHVFLFQIVSEFNSKRKQMLHRSCYLFNEMFKHNQKEAQLAIKHVQSFLNHVTHAAPDTVVGERLP